MVRLTLHRHLLALVITTLSLITTATASENWKIIHAGTLLAIPGQASKPDQSVVIHNGRIEEIRKGFVTPADIGQSPDTVKVIDLKHSFVMPGFIDLHVHLMYDPVKGSRYDIVRKTDADIAFDAYVNARKTFMTGFTTVRDLGSKGGGIFALRDAIKAGKIDGPKILVAGYPITPTGGHGDIHGFVPEVAEVLASSAVCDGPEGCRAAVRRQVKRGADVIKVTATGGVLSETKAGTGVQFTHEELVAIAEAAHALGRKVTAHAHGKAGIIAALEAGFDSIEHSMWADKETMKIFKKHDAWIIPTVYPITWVGDTPEKVMEGPYKDLPPVILEKLLKLGHQPKDMTALAHKMGVKIALGTDSGVSPHGENINEFVEYVNIGMTEMEALKAGTVDAAEAAGINDEVGSLEAGKAADIVAMPKSPLDNIEAVFGVDFIMRDGIVFKSK